MSSRHDPRLALDHIVENADLLAAIVANATMEALIADPIRWAALERCLQRISEAVFRLGDDAARLLPGQPVGNIRGIGNHLRHAYDELDPDSVWIAATCHVPPLRAQAAETLSNSSEPNTDTPRL